MGTEIEHKYLMKNDGWKQHVISKKQYTQAYLSKDPKRTVRVRIAGDEGFITIKGQAPADRPTETPEFEYAIPLQDAQALMKHCLPGEISKIRHIVMHDGHKWEIDVFQGKNAPLVLAEIELKNENEPYSHPDWLGQNVTGDKRFSNAALSENSFSEWPENAGKQPQQTIRP